MSYDDYNDYEYETRRTTTTRYDDNLNPERLRRKAIEVRANAERMAADLESRATRLESIPDDFENGDVIVFEKSFINGNRWYSYAAIKANDVWYTTGPKSPKAFGWYELMEWMRSGRGYRYLRKVTKTKVVQ